jgi:hypothetical protein
LQAIRAWTKANHFAIHDRVAEALGAKVADRFWNEHNFIFRKSDGLFYHAKGTTPAWSDFAPDSSGLTLIPLNMAEPILIARGRNANGLGSPPAPPQPEPHGLSRPPGNRRPIGGGADKGLCALFSGIPVSPSCRRVQERRAVRRQIAQYGLAETSMRSCRSAASWPTKRNALQRCRHALPTSEGG